MKYSKIAPCVWLPLLVLLLPLTLTAETNCEDGNGPLNPAQPQSISAQDISRSLPARKASLRTRATTTRTRRM